MKNPFVYTWDGLTDFSRRFKGYRTREPNIFERVVWGKLPWKTILIAALIYSSASIIFYLLQMQLVKSIMTGARTPYGWQSLLMTASNLMRVAPLAVTLYLGAIIRARLSSEEYRQTTASTLLTRRDVWYATFLPAAMFLFILQVVATTVVGLVWNLVQGSVTGSYLNGFPLELSGRLIDQPGRYILAGIWVAIILILPACAGAILMFIELNLMIRGRSLMKGFLLSWGVSSLMVLLVSCVQIPVSLAIFHFNLITWMQIIYVLITFCMYLPLFGFAWKFFRDLFERKPLAVEEDLD